MEITNLTRQPPQMVESGRTQPAEVAKNAAPSAPAPAEDNRYDSPVVNFDGATGAAILEFRDGATGEQTFQVPNKTTLEYRHRQEMTAKKESENQGLSA